MCTFTGLPSCPADHRDEDMNNGLPLSSSQCTIVESSFAVIADGAVTAFGEGRSQMDVCSSVKTESMPKWSDTTLKNLEAVEFGTMKDKEFQAWLGNDELQKTAKLVLPDVTWAAALSVEEGKLLGLDDAAFRPGQAFQGQEFWKEVAGESQHLMRWINDGYSVWVKDFANVKQIKAVQGNHINEHADFVTQEVAKLQALGVIEDITRIAVSKDEARCIMSLVVAVNAEGKKRLCWNGKPANALWDVPSFKFEGVQVALAMMRPGDFMFGFDLQKGYMQIPLKPVFRQFCCFEWKGKVYRYKVMPFGVSTGPRDFSKIVRAMIGRWRAMGIRCTSFIDDFVFFASSLEEALGIRDLVLDDLRRMGWRVSVEKSLLKPGQIIVHLGFVLCSVPCVSVAVPVIKQDKLRKSIAALLARKSAACTGKEIAVIAGRLQSMRVALPVVGMLTRALYAGLASVFVGGEDGEPGWMDFSATLILTQEMRSELVFWKEHGLAWTGRRLEKAPLALVLYTDKSESGYDGLLQRLAGRLESQEPALVLAQGEWENWEKSENVYAELMTLLRSLMLNVDAVAGKGVLHRGSNVATFKVLQTGGSRKSAKVNRLVRSIYLFVLMYGIDLSSQYVGKGATSAGPRMLSMGTDLTDCGLKHAVFCDIWKWAGPFDHDRFASKRTVLVSPDSWQKLPYTSLFAEEEASGVDAFSEDWTGVRNVAFPPVGVIAKVLELVVQQGAMAVIIVPRWPAQSWWPLLMECSQGSMVLGSPSECVGTPTRQRCFHPLGRDFPHPEMVVFEAHRLNM